MADHARNLDLDDIFRALRMLSPLQWAGGIAAAALAFVAVAGQERAAFAHLGLAVHPAAGRRAAMAAAAISQTAGFGPVIGAVVRRRLLPGLTLRQSATVSLVITFGFFAGLGVMVTLLWAHAAGGAGGLAAALLALSVALPFLRLLPESFRNHLPAWPVALRFALWLALDLTALALACWIVLPHPTAAEGGFAAFLPLFLLALGAGLASGSPAGAGPFEATLLNGLPEADPNLLVAGILAFRLVAYAVPATIGAIWALCGPVLSRQASAAPLPFVTASAARLYPLPRAELQLALHGETALRQLSDGALWLSADLPGVTVFLGDPTATRRDAAISDALRTAAHQGATPCLYRITPRLAATACRAGMVALPIAREAILDPQGFSTAGAARASLRRKLRHAQQAGVIVASPGLPPLFEMSDIASRWARKHKGERGFSMGRYDPATLVHQRLFTARGRDGRLLAFVTFHASRGEWVLDLIRSRPDLPDGTLYLLINHAIDTARAEGLRRLSLACAPIPGFGLQGLAGRIARHLTRRAEGLSQFKQAFRPHWERRYIAASGLLSLLTGGIAVAQAIHSPRPRRQGIRTTVTLELASDTT